MRHAERYRRAYTPLARTFPAWVSILSGEMPAKHGAVFNLRRVDRVRRKDLLTASMRDKGYRSIFAIDERRFAHINKGFGFDSVVGPRVGVLDFVLQPLNDNPLANAILQTSLGKYLFPFSYINVAASSSYSAQRFVEDVLSASEGAESLFLAVHFESAHFPFKTRYSNVDGDWKEKYLSALRVVDQQVGWLLEGLKHQGRLNDALVVFLSDHGEAIGEIEAEFLRDGMPFKLSGYGHGVDLLSDRQNRILLATARYRNGVAVGGQKVNDRHVSLLGVRQAVESFANGGSYLFPAEKCFLVETGVRFSAAADYRLLKEKQLAAEASSFYEIRKSGVVSLREERLHELLLAKDIGWRCSNEITWFDAIAGTYLAYRLDFSGKPEKQVKPSMEAIYNIEAYRSIYVNNLLSEIQSHR